MKPTGNQPEVGFRDDRKRAPCLGGEGGDKGLREITNIMFVFTIFLLVIQFILFVLHVLYDIVFGILIIICNMYHPRRQYHSCML